MLASLNVHCPCMLVVVEVYCAEPFVDSTTKPTVSFGIIMRLMSTGTWTGMPEVTATLAELQRHRAARNRHQAQRARHDMRTWQVERRKRTRHLIELGGLVVKAGIVDLTGDDRSTIFGAMIWMAEKLKSEDGEHARDTWTKLGKMGFEMERPAGAYDRTQPPPDGKLASTGGAGSDLRSHWLIWSP